MPRLFAVLPAIALLAACAGAPTDAPNSDEVVIAVRITGSIAGIDRTITLDGPSEAVSICERPCTTPPGEVVNRLERAEIRSLAATFVDAGVRSDERRDFGICEQCADQLHFELVYEDRSGRHRFVGDEPNFPRGLVDAMRELEATTFPAD